MKRLLTIWMVLSLLPYSLAAQDDARAKEVLDKTVAALTNAGGIRIGFEGTESGSLLMKGEKFCLHSGNVQSWYDGQTQWSYVADTEEVNISHPTPEELQGINPYHILLNYRNGFQARYNGTSTRGGKQGHEIVLTPREKGNRNIVTLFISRDYRPLYLKVEQDGQTVSEVSITSYRTNQQLDDKAFRFNKSLYPNAEVIDLR